MYLSITELLKKRISPKIWQLMKILLSFSIKNQDGKLGMWLFIYIYKMQKIIDIIVCSEVSEIRTCMLQICVVT